MSDENTNPLLKFAEMKISSDKWQLASSETNIAMFKCLFLRLDIAESRMSNLQTLVDIPEGDEKRKIMESLNEAGADLKQSLAPLKIGDFFARAETFHEHMEASIEQEELLLKRLKNL